MDTQALPTYFISHGGGPWPYVPDFRKVFAKLEASLVDIPRQIGVTPRAVLVISGHWEEPEFTVMSSARPPMVYDYSGFPPETYEVRYESPGSPEVAAEIQALLKAAGLAVRESVTQGYDHGTFVPLYIMYPEAKVPVLQMSLKSAYRPDEHLAVGRALASLRREGVLIIGSGLSYHNMRQMGPGAKVSSNTFDAWLQDTLLRQASQERSARLMRWAEAPMARQAHPREDHLLPLMVAVGAAEQEAATLVYHETDIFDGVTASSFRFG